MSDDLVLVVSPDADVPMAKSLAALMGLEAVVERGIGPREAFLVSRKLTRAAAAHGQPMRGIACYVPGVFGAFRPESTRTPDGIRTEPADGT